MAMAGGSYLARVRVLIKQKLRPLVGLSPAVYPCSFAVVSRRIMALLGVVFIESLTLPLDRVDNTPYTKHTPTWGVRVSNIEHEGYMNGY